MKQNMPSDKNNKIDVFIKNKKNAFIDDLLMVDFKLSTWESILLVFRVHLEN